MYYDITKQTIIKPSNRNFHLHCHNNYEIYMFLEGDAKYVVEENTYNLEPYDMIIIRKHEMHRIYHNSSTKYSRYVLSVSPEFFREEGCEVYETAFTDFSHVTGNKISADTVRTSGLYNAFLRLEKYSDAFLNVNTPIVKSVITEILYLINTASFSSADTSNSRIKDVIAYINNRYTENISLDELEKIFYVSKYHLCRAFKHATGLTVHGYITGKRLMRACELKADGKSLGDASALAGFSCYSAFYRAYVQRFGTSPKAISS